MNHPAVLVRRSSVSVALVAAVLVAGCGGVDGPAPTTDGGSDAGILDANTPIVDLGTVDAGDVDGGGSDVDAGDLDAGRSADGGGGSDGGAVGSVVAPAGEVVRAGTGGLLLRGTVLTPTGVLDPGEVLVVGNTITCVAADCSATAGAGIATIVDTHGIISPGLIDSHNHIAYDFLGEWTPPIPYTDRYTWANDPTYEEFIQPFADNRALGTVYCPCAKWGELRAIVHGTTTVLGGSMQQACVNGFVRNPDHYDGLDGDQLTTSIGDVRDITDAVAAGFVTRFRAAVPLTRLAVHMAEGTDPTLADEFESFAGRDTRAVPPPTGRLLGVSLLEGTGYTGTGVLIHSVPLTAAQLMEAADTHAKMVWSPSSNLVLYGGTADIGAWLALGLTVGLGPDWTLSGEDDMLGELRFARDYGRTLTIAALTPRRLWEMATLDGAEVVGLAPSIGRLEVGARADITVIGRTGGDPYGAVIDADARDVRLTMIDGHGYYGDVALEDALALNGTCDNFDACGTPKFLCVANVPVTQASGAMNPHVAETLEDVHAQLLRVLAGTIAPLPPGRLPYGRTDLLPLASECAP